MKRPDLINRPLEKCVFPLRDRYVPPCGPSAIHSRWPEKDDQKADRTRLLLRTVGEPKPEISMRCCNGVVVGLTHRSSRNTGVDGKLHKRKIAKFKMSIVGAFLEIAAHVVEKVLVEFSWLLPFAVERKEAK